MHVAFFNRSYYPDETATGQLLTDLCEDLVADHGCRVTVVSGMPTELSDGRPRPASREARRGVDIIRARGTRFSRRRFAGRASNYATYFISACWAGLGLDRPDVVVALTDPPIIGLAAYLAGKKSGAPLVMAFNDLFPEVAALLPDFQSPAINAGLQRVNEFLVKKAKVNVALGETMRRRLIEGKGAHAANTIVIHNWADTTLIVPGDKRNAFSGTHGLTDKFVVMHSGNLGLSQNLETLVEAAAVLRDTPDITFVFQGDGVKKTELLARTKQLALDNVIFLPFLPRERLSESFAAADLFVVSLQAGLAGYIVPSKLYGILAAGRPYVAAVEPECEVAALTSAYNCGTVVEPGSAEALAGGVMRFYRDRALAASAGRNARAASAAFDRRGQVKKYLGAFNVAIARAGAGRRQLTTESS